MPMYVVHALRIEGGDGEALLAAQPLNMGFDICTWWVPSLHKSTYRDFYLLHALQYLLWFWACVSGALPTLVPPPHASGP